jgi:hypothetical protein
MSLYDELKKLDELRQEGLLSEQEFHQQKARLLAKGPAPPQAKADWEPAQPPPFSPGSPPMPKTYLTESILVTLFCCLPLGIPAIVKSSQISASYAAGNYALAQQRSTEAAYWVKLAVILWGVGVVLYILICILAAIGSR